MTFDDFVDDCKEHLMDVPNAKPWQRHELVKLFREHRVEYMSYVEMYIALMEIRIKSYE